MDLAFLFVSAFAASTIVPMSSEVVLSALAASGSRQPAVLLAVATAGNTLGAVVNWGIGRCAGTWRSRLTSLEHFSVSSHQPAPPPNHPKGTIDGWLGGGAGRTRGSTQGENGLDEAKFQRACRWFNRWGVWCLLLSWLPVVGDPLTLVAGLLRTAFGPFVLLVLIGKASRYALILFLVS